MLESVVLMGAAAHHAASVGFRLLIDERGTAGRPPVSRALPFVVVQLVLWTACVLLALYVTAIGAHGMFHADPLDAPAMAPFALPGGVAAFATVALAAIPTAGRRSSAMVDALLSAVPTVLVLWVALNAPGTDVGRLDAIAGIATVPLLCVRALAQLGRSIN